MAQSPPLHVGTKAVYSIRTSYILSNSFVCSKDIAFQKELKFTDFFLSKSKSEKNWLLTISSSKSENTQTIHWQCWSRTAWPRIGGRNFEKTQLKKKLQERYIYRLTLKNSWNLPWYDLVLIIMSGNTSECYSALQSQKIYDGHRCAKCIRKRIWYWFAGRWKSKS